MVVQAPLTTVIYAPQQLFLSLSRPHHLALEVLHTLYHLSFIISEFGGISPESNSFTQLKGITYLAHDILAQEAKEVEVFVTHICSGVGILGGGRVYSFLALNVWNNKNIQVGDKICTCTTRYYLPRKLLLWSAWNSLFPSSAQKLSEIGYGRCVIRKRLAVNSFSCLLIWVVQTLVGHLA